MKVSPSLALILLPFSWLYGLGVRIRNRLFDWGILKEQAFDVPLICIGNLAVGGTGKTPHTEYLIRLLKSYQVAVLSRGYGRKTNGYRIADGQATAEQIGDEPFQIHAKFPSITVAVDENRVEGVTRLVKEHQPDVILLDDAFQHRYVKAGLNILLTDYHQLMTRDSLLPSGKLREPLEGKDRAHLIIITKCPVLVESEYDALRQEMQLKASQKLFFSSIVYGEPTAVFQNKELSWKALAGRSVLLLAGIANPTPLVEKLKQQKAQVSLMEFRDHHDFTERDWQGIKLELEKLGENALLLTTEKDAARLLKFSADPILAEKSYKIPIQVKIQNKENENFDQIIINFVDHNKYAKN